MEKINEAELIIADVTGRNPNVFYELGMAHVVKDKVVLITQNIGDVPFDLRHFRYIVYRPTPKGTAKLRKTLLETISAIGLRRSLATSVSEAKQPEQTLPQPAVQTPRPQVCGFYGTVTVDGKPVADGTVVSGWIDGLKKAEAKTTTDADKSVYALNVVGESALEGKDIVFKIGDKTAPAMGKYKAAYNVNLNLSYVTPLPPLVPAISISRTKGAPGTSVTVTGSGFGASERGITVTFDGTPVASGISANPQGAGASPSLSRPQPQAPILSTHTAPLPRRPACPMHSSS